MRSFLLAFLVCAAMFAIVPLMVWGGSGSWRHALRAFKQYLLILGGLVVLGGGLGLLMAFAEHGTALFNVFR